MEGGSNKADTNKSKASNIITPRSEDYSAWYLDVIAAADMAEYSPVKGCMIIKPTGYAIWENMQKYLDSRFKETGVENAYFPLFIPERFLNKEKDHVEGFAPEVAMVTHAGGKKLDEPLVIRPTSETIIYDTFSRWIQSYRDLPLLINQWANVVRWEMRPRLFLRTVEFLWQEGHTVHETEKEADDKAREMLEVYREFAENILAIPVILGTKSESEKFAGAFKTYCVEAIMQDGKALQFGTSHHLGQNFAKAFDVKFLGRDNTEQFGWQTSWGVSTRMIGGLIMTHADDKGLVLPPKIAPNQVVITTIINNDEDREAIIAKAEEVSSWLKEGGIRVKIDTRDIRPGEKFYEWERKGVPVRIELGKKDLANDTLFIARRDTGEKVSITTDDVVITVSNLLEEIQNNLFAKAGDYRKEKERTVDTWEDFVKEIEAGNFVLAHWSGDADVEAQIKEETAATIRCIAFDQVQDDGVCIKSGKPSKGRVIFAKSY
ncbi:MAG: proline--tRNA ligase [bacterium]